MQIDNLIKYVIGAKSTSKGVPVDVRLSLDTELQKTVLKTTAIIGTSIFLGVVTGFVISKKN
jgi:hypothetical protein